jgi:hypothetical protein
MYAFCTFPLTLPFLRLPAAKTYRSLCRTIGTRLCPLCASLPVLVLSFPRLPASSPQFPASRTVRMIYNQQYSLTVSSCRARLLHELDASRPAPACPDPVGGLSESASPSSGILLESCDPAKSSLFHGPRITDHQPGRRSRNCPSLHSTSFFSISCGLLLHNGRPQPFSFQSLPASFHRNGGVYPFSQNVFRERATPRSEPVAVPLRLQQIRFYPLSLCAVADHFLHNEGGTPLPQSRRPNETPFHPPR